MIVVFVVFEPGLTTSFELPTPLGISLTLSGDWARSSSTAATSSSVHASVSRLSPVSCIHCASYSSDRQLKKRFIRSTAVPTAGAYEPSGASGSPPSGLPYVPIASRGTKTGVKHCTSRESVGSPSFS